MLFIMVINRMIAERSHTPLSVCFSSAWPSSPPAQPMKNEVGRRATGAAFADACGRFHAHQSPPVFPVPTMGRMQGPGCAQRPSALHVLQLVWAFAAPVFSVYVLPAFL